MCPSGIEFWSRFLSVWMKLLRSETCYCSNSSLLSIGRSELSGLWLNGGGFWQILNWTSPFSHYSSWMTSNFRSQVAESLTGNCHACSVYSRLIQSLQIPHRSGCVHWVAARQKAPRLLSLAHFMNVVPIDTTENNLPISAVSNATKELSKCRAKCINWLGNTTVGKTLNFNACHDSIHYYNSLVLCL